MAQPSVVELAVEELQPGRYQPRRQLREDSLGELAESIREQGVLQPLIVRVVTVAPGSVGSKPYEIVAGERRWRAAQLAGLTTVPVMVRDLTDQSALAVALIENLQREDLNPVDQARSMSQLIEEFALTHDEIAKALGRSRAAVTNFLRLLDLADAVQQLLIQGSIDMGHARALLPLDQKQQAALARKIVRFGWSVRKVEKTVKGLIEPPPKAKASIDLQTKWLEEQLSRELGEKVTIRKGPTGDYVLQLPFGDLGKLSTGLKRLQELVQQVRNAAGPRARETSP